MIASSVLFGDLFLLRVVHIFSEVFAAFVSDRLYGRIGLSTQRYCIESAPRIAHQVYLFYAKFESLNCLIGLL